MIRGARAWAAVDAAPPARLRPGLVRVAAAGGIAAAPVTGRVGRVPAPVTGAAGGVVTPVTGVLEPVTGALETVTGGVTPVRPGAPGAHGTGGSSGAPVTTPRAHPAVRPGGSGRTRAAYVEPAFSPA